MNRSQLEMVQSLLTEFRGRPTGSLEDLRHAVNERNRQFPLPEAMRFDRVEVARIDKPALQMIQGTPSSASQREVMLYLHGGGFVLGDAEGFRGLAGAIAEDAQARVLIVDYRLAPESPYPAAVEDAADAYEWLLSNGTPASAVVMAGDSAGACLVLAALSVARNRDLPMPAAAVLFSPWIDLSLQGNTVVSKQAEDLMLDSQMLLGCVQAYLGGAAVSDPLASPLGADFEGFPPLLVQAGSAEILLDDSVRLASRAGAQGVAVCLEVWPNMPHVWQSFAPVLEEGWRAIRGASAFLRRHLNDARERLDAKQH
ncbi:monoterpene epsilon-lactone hydrolase [Paraburkholderia sp. UCT70]|uniref:alpha/beta hydrolase n=1 Tax=Paraburkholderia sp. UCT70 TaxID=2991068 RepID=UPI003D21F80A